MNHFNHAYLNPLLRLTTASLLFDALLLLLLSTVPSLASEAVAGNLFSLFWLMGVGACLGIGLLVTVLFKLWQRRQRLILSRQGTIRLLRELIVWSAVLPVCCFNTVLYSGTLHVVMKATLGLGAAVLASIFWAPPMVIAAQFGAIATILIKAQPGPFRWPRRTLLGCGVALVLSIILLAYRVPAQLAFQLARPSLEQALHNSDSPLNEQRVGLYWVYRQAIQTNGSTVFTLDSPPTGLFSTLSETGLAHQPDTSVNPLGEDEYYDEYDYAHLTGDWYTFEIYRNEYF